MLQEYVVSAGANADPELTAAFRENEDVIASQQERISILQFALVEKGVVSNDSHYAPLPPTQTSAGPQPSILSAARPPTPDGNGGIDL
ncbi:hypothetical protein AX17_001243 [Amanita inopinata Kibby_2008]|nr:hypothetical protein AX17_001243 [Amanita inopinata Kibby_2008]